MKELSAAAGFDGSAEAKNALDYLIRQIAETREQIKADDADIAQIRAEAATLKLEGAALKMESTTLKTETRAIIAGLRSIA